MKRIAVFMGTRPEAIKMAPVVKALASTPGLSPVVIATGQHREMLQQVIDLFEIPVHHRLDVMSPDQTLAGLSAKLISGVDRILGEEHIDYALVQGDTTTVLMSTLACYYKRIPVGHVEAGLRTGDIYSPFPEEGNRRLVSPLADLHFAPTESNRKNLLAEGIPDTRIMVTGNTVIDALIMESAAQEDPKVAQNLDAELHAQLGFHHAEHPFVLITGHRRENFGDRFQNICLAIADLAKKYEKIRFVYPVHLNPSVQAPVQAILKGHANVILAKPMSYRPFVALMKSCKLVLTDSGGVQEEAPGLGKPVFVMRDTTERPEGVTAGTVQLVGSDREQIIARVSAILDGKGPKDADLRRLNPYGDGKAGMRIAEALVNRLGKQAT